MASNCIVGVEPIDFYVVYLPKALPILFVFPFSFSKLRLNPIIHSYNFN